MNFSEICMKFTEILLSLFQLMDLVNLTDCFSFCKGHYVLSNSDFFAYTPRKQFLSYTVKGKISLI